VGRRRKEEEEGGVHERELTCQQVKVKVSGEGEGSGMHTDTRTHTLTSRPKHWDGGRTHKRADSGVRKAVRVLESMLPPARRTRAASASSSDNWQQS
jgi:hypothetical protein